MSTLTPEIIANTPSDDDLFELLSAELEMLLPDGPSPTDDFIDALRSLPPGFRAMAATYELDVSLALDDLGWHFVNWHHWSLAEETAAGLEELGAREMADIFRKAMMLAQEHWEELGSPHWSERYSGSELEKALDPLNDAAWAIHETKKAGLLSYWTEYARRHPERLQGGDAPC